MPRKTVVSQDAPKAIGPYSQAVWSGSRLFCSGQTPIDPAAGSLVAGGISEQTRQVFANLTAVLQAAGLSLDDVVKVNVYLRDINDFAAMNEVYSTYFTAPYPARTTIQAGALPRGFAVEIDCIARQ